MTSPRERVDGEKERNKKPCPKHSSYYGSGRRGRTAKGAKKERTGRQEENQQGAVLEIKEA